MFGVDAPHYPKTVSDEFFKYTKLKVEGFAGLQIRSGPYGAVSDASMSDGTVDFCCDKDMENEQFFKTSKWVAENGARLLELALESFVDIYWEMRELVIESLVDESPEEVVPEIDGFEGLRPLCGIVAVHVKPNDENNPPSFGLELGCTWEDEHGAGVRFEGLKVIESGYASEAFDF